MNNKTGISLNSIAHRLRELGDKGELAELLDLMDRVPLVRHAMLSHFQELKFKNKELIDEHLSQTRQNDGSTS